MNLDKHIAAIFNAVTERHNTVRYTIERSKKGDDYKINVAIDQPIDIRYAIIGEIAAPHYDKAVLESVKAVIDNLKEKK